MKIIYLDLASDFDRLKKAYQMPRQTLNINLCQALYTPKHGNAFHLSYLAKREYVRKEKKSSPISS